MNFSPSAVARQYAAVRESAPLVQCMTNTVVMNFTANILLTCGASPAMVDITEDSGLFTEAASALLVNLGTPYAQQRDAMRESVPIAARTGTPWVLDPVAVGPLPVRTRLAAELLPHRPTAIRGNPSEIMALAGVGGGGRGTDATNAAAEALPAAHELAKRCGSIVAISGPTDIVTDGTTDLRLGNGDELLTRVTGGGCALGALTAAFLAANPAQPLQAVAAATSVYTIAAETAAMQAAGPGSFAVQLVDALHNLDAATIVARAVIK